MAREISVNSEMMSWNAGRIRSGRHRVCNCGWRRLVIIALRRRVWNAAGQASGQLGVPRHNGQVQLALDGVELELDTLKLRADTGCDFLAKVGCA